LASIQSERPNSSHLGVAMNLPVVGVVFFT
jgi:hypothetical protein